MTLIQVEEPLRMHTVIKVQNPDIKVVDEALLIYDGETLVSAFSAGNWCSFVTRKDTYNDPL